VNGLIVDGDHGETGARRGSRVVAIVSSGNTALIAISVTILAIAIVKTLVTQILFADGAEYITRIASAKDFYFHAHRILAEWVMEVPTVVATGIFHVHSYHALAILLGVGYYIFPAIFCICAVYFSRNSLPIFCYATASSALLFCLSGGDGEVAFGQALFIVGSVVLLLEKRFTRVEAAVVVGVSILALNSYQGFAFWAPALAVLLFLHERRRENRSPWWFPPLNHLLLALSTAESVWAIFYTHSESGADALMSHALNLHYYSPAARHEILWTSILMITIAVLALAGNSKYVSNRPARYAANACVAALAISPWLWDNTVGPIDTYYMRGDTAGLIILLTALVCVWQRKLNWKVFTATGAKAFALGLVVFSLATTMVVATQWDSFQTQLSHENQRNGSYAVTALGIQPNLVTRFIWPWNNSLLGIILATREGHVGVTNVAPPQNLGPLVNRVSYYAMHPTVTNLPSSIRAFHW
jgi:hypothetical protein